MSRHSFAIPCTKQLEQVLKTKFKFKETPQQLFFAWGLDHDGYFVQIWDEVEDEEDLYIEDGLMGTNKSRIIEKLDRYGLLPFLREKHQHHLDCLVLDLPF